MPRRPKQNGPPFSGPFAFDIEPISWPARRAREPARAPVQASQEPEQLVPGQEPRAQVPLGRARPELPASSVPPVRALGPVCWPPAARQVRDARHFFRKHNTRQSPE